MLGYAMRRHGQQTVGVLYSEAGILAFSDGQEQLCNSCIPMLGYGVVVDKKTYGCLVAGILAMPDKNRFRGLVFRCWDIGIQG